jgi:hypothetical protein
MSDRPLIEVLASGNIAHRFCATRRRLLEPHMPVGDGLGERRIDGLLEALDDLISRGVRSCTQADLAVMNETRSRSHR